MALGPSEVDMDAGSAASEAFRTEWGRVVAALIELTGDWDVAEECAQDAFAKAAKLWPRDGVPRRPGAWLTTVARNRAVDGLRRASREAVWFHEAATLLPDGMTGETANPSVQNAAAPTASMTNLRSSPAPVGMSAS